MHSILSFIFTISLVVIVHELGHFVVAKIFKVSVEKFSVGFGKILYKKQIENTEFSLRLIPLGGFVKFYEKTKFKKQNLFDNISLFKRSLIVLAGPSINFLFAFILLLFLNQGDQFKVLPKVTAVKSMSVAAEAGFKVNDSIISINNKKIKSVEDHNKALIEFANQNLTYRVQRGNKKILLKVSSINRNDLKRNQLRSHNYNGLYFYPSGTNSLEINKIVPGSPAEFSGIRPSDRIVSVNDDVIYNISEFVTLISDNPNKEMIIQLLRGDEFLSIPVTPTINNENIRNTGVIGIMIKQALEKKELYIISFKYNYLDSFIKSIYDLYEGVKMVFKSFINIIAGNIDWRLLSGPVSIAELSSETLSMGLLAYLSFLVFLNINVGFLNLLPIPVLDGGQLFFYMVEGILGRPIKRENMIISQRLGVIILFLVFTLAVYNDVFNFINH